jgi:hypothetical protein
MINDNLLKMLYELKETQTRREDKQLDKAIKACKDGHSQRLVLAILNGEIKVD